MDDIAGRHAEARYRFAILGAVVYLRPMRSTYSPCLPTSAKVVPATSNWLHEVKYDGYRLIVAREGNRVRLFTRNGHDWSGRYPWIVESALKNRHTQFVIDGEAVILGLDGASDFNALHSRQRDEDVQLYAFDILALDGEDLRGLPLSMRKANLARSRAAGHIYSSFSICCHIREQAVLEDG